MSGRGRYEDLTTVLYIVPFLVSGIYGLILWVQAGISLSLPPIVYLTVTRDPYVFMAGSLSVMLGLMIEVSGADPAQRRAKLASLATTLQAIAGASIIFALLGAIYANGTDVAGLATDFLAGRYNLIFPALMVLLSFLITARFNSSALGNTKIIGSIAFLLALGSIYAGKHEPALGEGIAFVFIVLGTLAFLSPVMKKAPPKQV